MTTVLTIDDEKSIREAFRYFLEDYDYNVLEAANGKEGLDLFERENPDLVLLDLRMPEINGLETLKMLTHMSPDTPVIVISGTGMVRDAVDALHLGAWDYLLKPVEDLDTLRHAIERALERARLLKENREYRETLEQKVRSKTAALEAIVKDLVANRKKLEENETLLANVFESIQDGIVIMDKDMTIRRANDVMKRMRTDGVASEGKKCHAFFYESEMPCVECPTRRCIKSGVSERAVVAGPPGSSAECVEIVSHPIRDRASGEITGAVKFLRDITEQKRAEEERKMLELRLRQAQKMEAVGTLAGGIAHDFNNILYGAIGFSEMAMADVAKESRAAICLEQIGIAHQRAANLVRQLLAFGKQNGQDRRPLRIQPVIAETLELMRGLLPATIQFRQHVDPACLPVLADPTGIQQVVMNLSTNAYQAMREQGGTLSVSLENCEIGRDHSIADITLEPGNYVRLGVSDTGHGIDPEIQKRIFDPYFSTRKSGEGTGLGLSTVHAIVQDHGGAIRFNSVPGKGTTFHVWFPVCDDESNFGESSVGDMRGDERVLIVDDDEPILMFMKTALTELGYSVVASENSVKALEIFMAHPSDFDVVITDQTMPHLLGGELANKMLVIRPDIPIILCTGFSETPTYDKAGGIGIRECVSKPVSICAIAGAIRRVLNNKS